MFVEGEPRSDAELRTLLDVCEVPVPPSASAEDVRTLAETMLPAQPCRLEVRSDLPPSVDKIVRTVGDLQDLLREYPRDLAVLATWEGIFRVLTSEGAMRTHEYGDALVFDVEHYWPVPRANA